jgi:glycopeptide antibiotics resistance protein
MTTYLDSISTAAFVFPIIAFALTIPYALYSYHKYGSISFLRSVILFSFLFYLQCAYYLIILPLPDPAEVATWTGPYYQAVPFYFVYDAAVHASFDPTSLRGWASFLASSFVAEPLFNFLLTLPFGIYLSYYFKSSLKKVLLLSFALSLFFELSQLSGLYGLYPRPYRLADVDDLILNTLGGVAGYFVYTRFLGFLPSKERIDRRSAERSVSVGYLRRLAALFVDSLLVLCASWLVTTLFSTDATPTGIVVFLLYYPLFALPFRGRTPGKMLVRIKLETVRGTRPLWPFVLLRYLLRNTLIAGYQLYALLTGTASTEGLGSMGSTTGAEGLGSMGSTAGAEGLGSMGSTTGAEGLGLLHVGPLHQDVLLVAVALASALLLLDFLLSFRAKRGRRLWYECLSRTRNVSTLSRP